MRRDEHGTDADASEGGAAPRSGRFEWDRSEGPSAAVVGVVATAARRDPATPSPLNGHVDSEALDALLRAGSDRTDGRLSVSFGYEGVEVTVGSDGRIDVREETTAFERALAPATDAELNAMLRELLRTAFRNGLAVGGGWDVRNGPGDPDRDVVVTRLEKPGNATPGEGVDSGGRS